MVSGLHELTALENEAAVFIARFWRDFYRSMLTHTARSTLSKLLVIAMAMGMLFLLPHRALAADRLNLVVMVDLTQSVAVKGHDGKAECEKNLRAVNRLLTQVPAGSHVTVLGITDNSFAQPYILLSADVPDDEGYFKEKLTSSRRQLVRIWQKRIVHLQGGFTRTDILGALLLADQLFHERPTGWRDVLVIFSDMRQDTADVNLETPPKFDARVALGKTEKNGLIARLGNVQVYVLGVDNAGKPIAYWTQLRGYWLEYFARAGAHVETYSVLRETTAMPLALTFEAVAGPIRGAALSPLSSPLNEPKNGAVVIGPKTRRDFGSRRSVLQSWDLERGGMSREQYPLARLKGIFGGAVVIEYCISVEVCARSLQDWNQVNVSTTDVDCDDSTVWIQELPVRFKSLLGQQMDWNCVPGKSIEDKDIELLDLPFPQFLFQQ